MAHTSPVVEARSGQDLERANVRPMGVPKRAFDVTAAIAGIAVVWPVLLCAAACIKLFDRGPILFRQERVGRGGKLFRIWKFRSMVVGAERVGRAVTASGDARVTPVGRVMRRTKLDELPQLMNVLTGDMSFVGPRPEVASLAHRYSGEQRRVFELTPGITQLASLYYRDEDELLARADDPEQYYLNVILPDKVQINLEYADRATVWSDIVVILRTLFPWLGLPPRRTPQPHPE
jgi:lipopolysaccharide/colanic/teichoic acid biosynthesis glycosyltransferase